MPKNGNLGFFEAVDDSGTVFTPRHCLHHKVAMGMENLKLQSLSRRINAMGVTARQVTRIHASRKVPKMEIWEYSKLSMTMLPSFHQGNVYIKR